MGIVIAADVQNPFPLLSVAPDKGRPVERRIIPPLPYLLIEQLLKYRFKFVYDLVSTRFNRVNGYGLPRIGFHTKSVPDMHLERRVNRGIPGHGLQRCISGNPFQGQLTGKPGLLAR